MEAYTDFAGVYDTFMDETPYEEWCEFLVGLLKQYGTETDGCEQAQDEKLQKEKFPDEKLRQERNSILDLGCGTGTLTGLLAAKGYDMIGIDNSPEMLRIAMEKREQYGLDILYLLQDMREFELYGTVGAVISVCDSLNYLLDEKDLAETFRLVNNYLYPGGLFIFDFNTVYKYEVVIGDTTIAENREDCSFIWENYYHSEEEINEYDLTIFVKDDSVAQKAEENDGACFRRFCENHYQRGYRLEQMKRLVEEAGMEFIEAIDADTHEEVTEVSERIYVVAREQGKKNF